MAVSTLDQIIAQLNTTYQPQVDLLRQQQTAIPGQIAEQQHGLEAQQQQAFGDITDAARRRGLGFSGIPLSEQAKYTSTSFLPALANLRQQGNDKATTLEQAILGLNQQRGNQAYQIQNDQYTRDFQQQQFDEQKRQFDAQMAAQERARAATAANSFNPNFGGGSNGAQGGGANSLQRADKGFNFFDASGKPISAAIYAQLKGIPFRDLLTEMANGGDQGAKQALGFVGNDFGYDPNKVNSQGLASLYNALAWGTGRTASYNPVRVNNTPNNAAVRVVNNPFNGSVAVR